MRVTARELLTDVYSAAVAGAAAAPVTAAALRGLELPRDAGVWVLALGKAAEAMAGAAVEHLRALGREPAGGLTVAPSAPAAGITRSPGHALPVVRGDHPVPGAGSLAAADRVGELVARVGARDRVLVLLSGGASSLVGAPVPGVAADDLAILHRLLLGSGLDIAASNLVRKRFSRWGAGRLACALEATRVHCLAISDVPGDDLATIGSGPCVPDISTAAEIRDALRAGGLDARTPAALLEHLEEVGRGAVAETPKPGHSAFARVDARVIASNRLAREAAAARARELGIGEVVAVEELLSGDAAARGREIAHDLLRRTGSPGTGSLCIIRGGETTVTLHESAPAGGRCQELALAAAGVLDDGRAPEHGGREMAGRVTLLAAGTDGRDGPTDAAGAIVDGDTWRAVRAAGRDPAQDLAEHASYDALRAAGALLRTGLTGTNVMDVVIGLVER